MTMSNHLRTAPSSNPACIPPPCHLSIETFSYEDRGIIFPAVSEALELSGSWLLERRQVSFTQVEYRFELHLRSVLDLYAALIAAGLELTRASHKDLTVLCTLRNHIPYPTILPGLVTVGLIINFLEEITLSQQMSPGLGQA